MQYHMIKKCQWRSVCDGMHKNLNQAVLQKVMIHVYGSCRTACMSVDIGDSGLRLLKCELHSNMPTHNGKGVMQEGSDEQHSLSSFLCNLSYLAQMVGVIWSFSNFAVQLAKAPCVWNSVTISSLCF